MEKISFNENWIFKTEDGKRTEQIDLPHDAMILETRRADAIGGSGVAYFPGGIYFYEKNFEVPVEWEGKSVFFEFEGVYQNAKVFINNKEVGGYPNGYFPFLIEATENINYGGLNNILVLVDNSKQPNSRWYTGSGIYRPVWLHVGNKNHILHQGVKISTLEYKPARIQVDTQHTEGEITVEILYQNQVVAKAVGSKVEILIPDAKLWSDEFPQLYQCRVVLWKDNQVEDEVIENFGIRKVDWSAKGLFVNGKEVLLRGGCVHHDNGILGARSYAESEERRVRILKKAGYNAIRSSHNPASKAMLTACDKYGMYMIDETWDMWYFHKSKYDYATYFMDWYKKDIQALIDRDFNHPSVIMYSIGNEISEPKDTKGIAITEEIVNYFHSMDQNRAITCGVNLMIINMASKGKGIYKEDGGLAKEDAPKKKKDKATSSTLFNMMAAVVGTGMNKAANSKKVDGITSPCLDILDIAGYNYASGRYPLEGKAHPKRVVFGSETFPQDIAKNWKMVKKYPYLVGDFMWTSWDYIGEAGIGAWSYTDDARQFNKPYPWLLADTGTIDILGNIGAEAEYAATVWGVRKKPYIGVRPLNHPKDTLNKAVWRGTNAMDSWSWKDCHMNKTIVEVYADAAKIELILNGKSLGVKKIKDYKTFFKLRYTPGELVAIAYDNQGKEKSRSQLSSSIGKIDINIQPEKNSISTNEILYINLALMGENGVVESNFDQLLEIEIENGELLAFGSANPRTMETYNSTCATTYYGKAQAIVRCKNPGIMKINVGGKKLTWAIKEIAVQ